MQFKHILATGFLFAAKLATAEFDVFTQVYSYASVSDPAKASSRAEAAASSYFTHLTAEAKHSSINSVLVEFLATRTDLPAVLTATDKSTTYTTVPTFFTALPKEVQSYISSVDNGYKSVVESAWKNDAPQPTAAAMLNQAAGMAFAGALGGAALLF